MKEYEHPIILILCCCEDIVKTSGPIKEGEDFEVWD